MRHLALSLSVLILAACGSGDGLTIPTEEESPPQGPAQGSELLEIIHASPDAPNVNITLNGEVLVEDAPYKAGLVLQAPNDEVALNVLGLVPGAEEGASPLEVSAVSVIEATLPTPAGTRVTVFAANAVADIEPIVITAPIEELPADTVRLRVVHAAPIFDPEMVSVYLTAPDEELGAPTETFAFGSDFGPVDVPAGDYRVRITPAGDTDTLLFDSGPLPLSSGADLVVAAVASALPEVALSLLIADGSDVTELTDARLQSTVRVVHAAPDAPNVDVLINDGLPAAIADLAFPEFTDRLPIEPADYNFKVVPNAAGPETAVIEADLTLVAGVEYSVYAIGLLESIEPLVLVDDNRRVGTEARLRIVHAAPSAGDVDIYLASSGAELDAPALAAVPFSTESGYLSVAPGSYDVIVAPADGDPLAPAIGPLPVILEAGGIYTVVARDAAGGGAPFNVISLDDELN